MRHHDSTVGSELGPTCEFSKAVSPEIRHKATCKDGLSLILHNYIPNYISYWQPAFDKGI